MHINLKKLIKKQTGSINLYQQSVYLASLDRHSEQAAAGVTDDILSWFAWLGRQLCDNLYETDYCYSLPVLVDDLFSLIFNKILNNGTWLGEEETVYGWPYIASPLP